MFIVVVLASLAVAGWWRASTVDHRADRLEAGASDLRETNAALEVELDSTADDAEESLDTVARLRARAEKAEANARDMQDCVAIATDEDGVGPRTVVFGFIELGEGRTLSFDEAEWFSGEGANRAALEDGAIEQGDVVPNDYYIRNDDRAATSVAVADDVTIVTSTASRYDIPAPRCKSWGKVLSSA